MAQPPWKKYRTAPGDPDLNVTPRFEEREPWLEHLWSTYVQSVEPQALKKMRELLQIFCSDMDSFGRFIYKHFDDYAPIPPWQMSLEQESDWGKMLQVFKHCVEQQLTVLQWWPIGSPQPVFEAWSSLNTRWKGRERELETEFIRVFYSYYTYAHLRSLKEQFFELYVKRSVQEILHRLPALHPGPFSETQVTAPLWGYYDWFSYHQTLIADLSLEVIRELLSVLHFMPYDCLGVLCSMFWSCKNDTDLNGHIRSRFRSWIQHPTQACICLL
jgi:hypothetical protein